MSKEKEIKNNEMQAIMSLVFFFYSICFIISNITTDFKPPSQSEGKSCSQFTLQFKNNDNGIVIDNNTRLIITKKDTITCEIKIEK